MRKQQIKAAITAAVLGVVSPLAMAIPASAATQTWNGSTDEYWAAFTNWDVTRPVNGDTVVFPATSSYDYSSATVRATNNDLTSLSLAKIVFNGAVSLSSTSFSVEGSALTLTEGIDAVMTGNGGDHSVEIDVTLGAAATFKTTGSNTLSVGGASTVLDLGANDLTLDASGGTISLLGKIKGSGNLIKSGTSKVKLMTTPDDSGYTGGLTLSDGETSVDDALGLNVTVSGGTLKGTGTVGNIAMSSGVIAPGNSPGVINTGNLDYTGGTFDVELGGTAAGEFDQTNVTGTVKLGTETTLNIALVNSFAPAINDSFIIVNNDGADAVEGNFKGLADGSKVIGAYTYQINYNGGDGNDVILLVTGNPSAPDTGIGSIIGSPLATLAAAIVVAGAVIGYRFYETKKAQK